MKIEATTTFLDGVDRFEVGDIRTVDNDRGGGVTPERAAEMQQLAPKLQTVHIPGAGHNVRREQFALYMKAVTAFLAQTTKGA